MLNKQLEENQKNMFKSLLYYVIATDKGKKLESILELLEYDKKTIENLLDGFKSKHLTVVYFNKLKDINYSDYDSISKKLKDKVKYAIKINNNFPDFFGEIEVDIYAEKIIDKKSISTMEEYIEYLIKKENKKAILLKGINLYYYDKVKSHLGLSLMEDSATKGESLAFFYLGEIYYEGIRIEKNYVKSENFLKQFIEIERANDEYYMIVETAKNILAKIYYFGGNGLIKRYDLALQIFKDIDEDYYDKYSLLYMGLIYMEGRAEEKNEELGFKYLKKAAEQNVAKAQVEVAKAYLEGLGTEVDYNKTVYWIEKAASNNSNEAKYLLGISYYYGDENIKIEKNENYGIKLLTEAAKAGVDIAAQELELIKKSKISNNEPDRNENIDERSEIRKNWFDGV